MMKVLQAFLLLRRPGAYLRWRAPILWTERIMRTLVCVRLVAYGEGYKAWLTRSSALQSTRILL